MKLSIIMLLILTALTACNDNQQEQSSTPVKTEIGTEIEIEIEIEKQQQQQKNTTAKDESEENKLIELVYKDLNGQEVKLSDYRGKWVVVNFWATWCPPCRKEIPDFVKFKKLFADKVEIFGINSEDAELSTIQGFALEYKINYPILMADVYNPTEFERENSKGLPTTVIFNPKGEQVTKRVGPIHFKDLVEITGFVLKETTEKPIIGE